MNPYAIEGPAVISFSGGRTSGYMLWSMLNAYGGTLAPDVHVTFANTGKERPETLDFVQECANQWSVPIHWLEYAPDGPRGHKYEVVDYESASRHGEPFAALIRKKGYLPNPVTRMCTLEIKVRVMRDYAKALGWKRWTNVVGLRADEMNRVAKAAARNAAGKDPWTTITPLAVAGATVNTVMGFWDEQPFDLQLRPHEGNCDLCFLKGAKKISAVMREHPELAEWWIEQEATVLASKPSGARFRIDRPSYAEMLAAVHRQAAFDFGVFDDLGTCDTNMCTD